MTIPAYDFVTIGPNESVAGRAFTDLGNNSADVEALTYQAARLRDIASSPLPSLPHTLVTTEPGGRYLRTILCQPNRLKSSAPLFIVGFFGKKRIDAKPGPLTQVDDKLVESFAEFPPIVSYSSLQLSDGNFGNLVILSDPAGRESWREGKTHQYAVAELAPAYYETVRLHNGLLHGPASRNPQIELTSTKYFDYQGGLWCGLRQLSQ